MILGVSGWLGKKIGLEERQVRLLFIVAFLLVGTGVLLYLGLWVFKVMTEKEK